MNLQTKHVPQLIRPLEQAQQHGEAYVVFEMRPMDFDLQPHQLDFYDNRDDALDAWEDKMGYGYLPGDNPNPVYYMPVEQMLSEVRQADNLLNDNSMNKNNLENLQGEMRALKFDGKLIEQMEKEMAKGQPGFQLKTQVPADNGQMDVTLNFKRSGSSEYYFLNRYDLALSKAKPLEEGKHYLVISPNPDKQKENLVKKFDSAIQAIDYFKSQKNVSELAMGKNAADKMTLATMEKGKVDYVNKEFRTAYYSPVITNSQYVDRGRGFNVIQAANMLQGRAAYRDDLVSRATGEMYKAWNVHQFDEPKDKYGNYKVKQYSEGYGFDVQKELDKYTIKEMSDPKKRAQLIESLKDGNKPVVTVVSQDGQEHKLRGSHSPVQ
ncbi:hypothetical protein [Pedobacter deserti]|uniref:hypothetical protein n=1 Tax=Pedobacter deserti TaxID=2817382 RepID=UPI0021098746|nr:hypothetical protein [Pedobacter sp. SYSU D00382]